MESLSSVTLLGLLDPEDGSTIFLRNVGKDTSIHDVTSRNARIYSKTAIPRLTKIIRSGITFVSRNLRQPKRDFA